MAISLCVFDAYGTLFDVNAAARTAAADDPRLIALWPKLAEDWRKKQLEYSWLREIMGQYADFWQLTGEALDWAMEAAGISDTALRDRLMALYGELPAYPEVPQVLTTLRARGLKTAILSNGAPGMLADAVRSARIGGLLDAVLSVHDIARFKPAMPVYALVAQRFGTLPDEVLFVSSNGWDAAGATGAGFEVAWVNRAGLPMDRLPYRPAHQLSDLGALPGLLSA